MPFYDRLQTETTAERDGFLSIPVIDDVLRHGASRALYLAYFAEAYHHVKHTFPELARAASLTEDESYQDALFEYMKEERGHEKWILDGIAALGGDAEAVSTGHPGMPCRVMVAYTYYAIERISPYAMLGSVHVLEGISTMLADKVADRIMRSLGQNCGGGFSYLRSHGSLDIEHVAFFRKLADGIVAPDAQAVITETSKTIYHLYGGIFRDLGERYPRVAHAA